MKKLITVSILFLLAACSTTPVTMSYKSSAGAEQGKALTTIGEVSDNRKYKGTALGGIRGGLGNELKTLELEKPASDITKDVVSQGLKFRGLLASGDNKYTLNIDIRKFDCNQYVRREAHIDWNVTLVDKSSNQVIYSKNVVVDKKNGSVITLDAGLFASVEDLRALANEALQEAVDQLLNDPAFIAKFK